MACTAYGARSRQHQLALTRPPCSRYGQAFLTPGPDHPISITLNLQRVTVTTGGHMLVNTTRALVLQESDYPAVHYVPHEDTNTSVLESTESHT